jgi:hypothetical protein
MKSRLDLPEHSLAEHQANSALPGAELRRLELLSDDGYYACLENDGRVIKLYSRDGMQLFGLNPEMISFEVKPLTVALQTYVMAYNQGHKTGYEACKSKVTEMLKLCL